jgi:hypothetical protein
VLEAQIARLGSVAGRDVVVTFDRQGAGWQRLPVRENCTVQPRLRFQIRKAYEELATPVKEELRREPIVDADVPCPRCGGREWLLVERRAEPEEPFTRWRALACASCGAADGWESAGRARRGRAADGWNDWDATTVAGMPEEPTLDDVLRLAPFRVLGPCASAELRSYSHAEGKITAVTVGAGGVEVTTEIRHQILHSLPVERHPQIRARERLQDLLDDSQAVLRQPRSEPARELHVADAGRRAEARAAATESREAMIDVVGSLVSFTVVDHEGHWAAVADIGDESITIAARDVPSTGVALQAVSPD